MIKYIKRLELDSTLFEDYRTKKDIINKLKNNITNYILYIFSTKTPSCYDQYNNFIGFTIKLDKYNTCVLDDLNTRQKLIYTVFNAINTYNIITAKALIKAELRHQLIN